MNIDVCSLQNVELYGYGFKAVLFSAVTKSGKKVIIRQLKMTTSNFDAVANAIREIAIMRACNHKNIIKPYTVFTKMSADLVYVNIVLPRLKYSVAYFNLPENRPTWCDEYMLPRIQNIIYGVLKGIEYLHRNGITHRNISMNNVMLDEYTNATIIDFGISCEIDRKMTQLHTPRRFAAPESTYFGNGYTEKADLWSVGCMLTELLVGEKIAFLNFGRDREIHAAVIGHIKKAKIPKEAVDLDELNLDNIVSLVKKLLVIDVTQRYTATEALTCSFFGDWVLVEPDNEERIMDNQNIIETFHALKINRKNEHFLKQLLIDIGKTTKDECEVSGVFFEGLKIT